MRRFRSYILAGGALAIVLALTLASGCKKAEEELTPEETLPTSLHGTTYGMKYWYEEAEPTGLYHFTQIPYDSLTCKNCHADECSDCHVQPGDTPPMDSCLVCHGRQKRELMVHTDVHIDEYNKICADCHTDREAHGDGTSYLSLRQEGAMDAQCENCHNPDELPSNAEHTMHLNDIHCTACHNQAVVTCYNCHFESELQYGVKLAHKGIANWIFLVNYRGKIHAGNIMAITYNGNSFIAIGPYNAHTISRQGRTCNDCHHAPAVEQYRSEGVITATWWDSDSSALYNLGGVIPVPPNYETALQFAFVQCVSGCENPQTAQWAFLKDGTDRWQILFAAPLTQEQMDKLLNNP